MCTGAERFVMEAVEAVCTRDMCSGLEYFWWRWSGSVEEVCTGRGIFVLAEPDEPGR